MLPRDFLIDIARKYELSSEQEEIFVEMFGSQRTQLDIAESIHISESACRERMRNVYKKFSIGGKGPGKKAKLQSILMNEFQKNTSKIHKIQGSQQTITSFSDKHTNIITKLEIFHLYSNIQEDLKGFYTIFETDNYENCIDNFLNLSGYNNSRVNLYNQLLSSWKPSDSEMWEYAVANTCLGDSLSSLEEYDSSIKCFEKSLEISNNIDDLETKAGSLINIGLEYYYLGNFELAFEYTTEGLNLAEDIEHDEFLANALNNMGLIYSARKRYNLAIYCYKSSIAINQDLNIGDVGSLINLGDTYRCIGKSDDAIKFLVQGIELAKKIGDRRFEVNGWCNLALTLEEMEQNSQAIKAYENAINLYKQMGMNKSVHKINDAIQRLL